MFFIVNMFHGMLSKKLNFESCVWRVVSSHSSHHPHGVLLAQFSLYVHKSGLRPASFCFGLQNYTKYHHGLSKCNTIHLFNITDLAITHGF